MSLYVNYGCHHSAPAEWLNFDASPTLRLERLPVIGRPVRKNTNRFLANVLYGNIVRGLSVAANSCSGVYCSHVLEHLALEDHRRALLNTYRMMKKGALFRMVMPDLEQCIKNYISDDNVAAYRAEEFMKQSGLGQTRRPRGIYSLMIEAFGNSRHRWMWDFNSMKQALQECGFKKVRRAYFGDSNGTMFKMVEQEERWNNSLGIECTK
jgi:hypothetical protein